MQCTSGICRHCRETLEAQYSGSQLKTPEKSVEAMSKSFPNLSLVSTTSSRICVELVSFSQSLLISQSKCLATDYFFLSSVLAEHDFFLLSRA